MKSLEKLNYFGLLLFLTAAFMFSNCYQPPPPYYYQSSSTRYSEGDSNRDDEGGRVSSRQSHRSSGRSGSGSIGGNRRNPISIGIIDPPPQIHLRALAQTEEIIRTRGEMTAPVEPVSPILGLV